MALKGLRSGRNFLYSTREQDWASFPFGTLLSKYGCILLHPSFRKKRPCLTTRATPVKGVAGPYQIDEIRDAYGALITLHARVVRKTNEYSNLLRI